MNLLLRSIHSTSHYPPASLASNALHRIGNPKFPSLLWTTSLGKTVNGLLTRVARESLDPDYSFIASTALAALAKNALSLSRLTVRGAQQAQYGIAVRNRANEFLGILNFDVRYSAAGGYEAITVNFRRSETSPPVELSLTSCDVLDKLSVRAGQDLLTPGVKARNYPRVKYSELIKARSKLNETTRKYSMPSNKA
jgi:hypothetical protein